jgi:hypothetical protein
MREVDADAETLAATREFVSKYRRTVNLALVAAQAEGECRFPVKFEQGIEALLPHAQKLRSLVRLLLLDSQLCQAQGDKQQALGSLDAIFAAQRSLSKQSMIVEHLVALAITGVALKEAERLVNTLELSDEELAHLELEVNRLEIEEGLTRALIGERQMGYQGFYHLGQLTGSKEPSKFPGEGQLTLPVDCRYYLQVLGDTIEASRQPYPEAIRLADQVDARMSADMKKPVARFTYTVTFLLAPALNAAFDVTARNIARRDATLCALAAQRHRLKHGQLPAKLADLVPEFLPAVPTDPFDGQPLRMLDRVSADKGDALLFYSVGKDRKDDGGVETSHSAEPDIVVTLKNRSK